MMQNFDAKEIARIRVVGVGGGGSNAVSRMFRERMPGRRIRHRQPPTPRRC